MLKNKNIVLGLSGGIAAYKSALLLRLLVKSGANVKVVMTPAATQFITPLTLSTLSKNPVFIDFKKSENTGEWNNHVELALWADLIIIAPATANTIGKMANGLCDNLLLAVYLSAKCKVMIAPAMDLDMWLHPSVQKNIASLQQYKNQIIKPEKGELASGLKGVGRMAEPENIFNSIVSELNKQNEFSGKKIIITAGPTYEAIDPVRFIGNHSSGKMGFALAETLAKRGAQVFLISGPTSLQTLHSNITRTDVTSAAEMFDQTIKLFKQCDIAILAAAVADFKPAITANQKIKKSNAQLSIALSPTLDILEHLGKTKKAKQLLVGFALETENEIENAKQKIKKKNLDLIVLNSLNDKGAGFKSDTNKITLINKQNKITYFELKNKEEVAEDIANAIQKLILKK
jgi:phosphopantothenoylcysteine decarboxylase / phosphopantothenate---cysteine ligase